MALTFVIVEALSELKLVAFVVVVVEVREEAGLQRRICL